MYIHSVLFAFLGTVGIICAVLLHHGLSNSKKYQYIIYWICFQGLSIFHQMFFSLEIYLTFNHLFKLWVFTTIVIILFLLAYLALEIILLVKIINIYQSTEELEAPPATPRVVSSWRIPTIGELMGDESEIGTSTPPIYTISNANAGLNSTSHA